MTRPESNKRTEETLEAAIVARVVADSLVYATTLSEGRAFAFVPTSIIGYAGEQLADIGIIEGAAVEIQIDRECSTVTRVKIVPSERKRDMSRAALPSFRALPSLQYNPAPQLELLPEVTAGGVARVYRALPGRTRKFGKLIDTNHLWPGDLLLSRPTSPETISQRIIEVQVKGGYAPADARWTHAAMYLGDDENVIEATFDSALQNGNVRMTSLDEYCQGDHAVRFRRPKYLKDQAAGWRLCVRALSRMKRKYDFGYALHLWFNVIVRQRGFYDNALYRAASNAVVCSTLYADAYNEATRRSLGEVNGTCVPAFLSVSEEFDDVGVRWLAIQD